MEVHSSSGNKFLSPKLLRWSWALVIVCGLVLGYYLLQTYGLPRHRQYQLDFGKAQWIEPTDSPAPIAYFRKEVYLSSLPAQAWIEIAASDTFGLIVNGHTIGNLGSIKTYEAGIYDIKRALKTGTNVIAVSISRTSYPGPAQLLLRGEIVEEGGRVTHILSDESWRVANKTGIVAGSEEWNSQHVPDQTWPTARRSPINDQHVAITWVDTNPLLLQLPRIGYWIMADNAASEAVFSTTINADRSKQETWIQVASSGDLDLAVNEHIITLASSAIKGAKKLPHLSSTEEDQSQGEKPGRIAKEGVVPAKEKGSPFQSVELSAYDVSNWIKRGQNVIIATVRSEHIPASLYINGFIVEGSKVERFSTNASWRVGDQPNLEPGAAHQRAVQIGPRWGRTLGSLAPGNGPVSRPFGLRYSIPIVGHRWPHSWLGRSSLADRFRDRLQLAWRASGQCDGARCSPPRTHSGGLATHGPSELRSPIPS